MQTTEYPFAQTLITDADGRVQQVILDVQDYQQLIELIEDEGLYRLMEETRGEESFSLEEALIELEKL